MPDAIFGRFGKPLVIDHGDRCLRWGRISTKVLGGARWGGTSGSKVQGAGCRVERWGWEGGSGGWGSVLRTRGH